MELSPELLATVGPAGLTAAVCVQLGLKWLGHHYELAKLKVERSSIAEAHVQKLDNLTERMNDNAEQIEAVTAKLAEVDTTARAVREQLAAIVAGLGFHRKD